MSAEQGLTMTQFQPIHRYTPLSHTIFIYISFDIHIPSVCHTSPSPNNASIQLLIHRCCFRRRRCSRPHTRSMSRLVVRLVRDVRRLVPSRIRLTRRRFIWIHYYSSPT